MEEQELLKMIDIVSGWSYKEWCTFAHYVNRAFDQEKNSALNRVKLSDAEGLKKMLCLEMGYSVTS